MGQQVGKEESESERSLREAVEEKQWGRAVVLLRQHHYPPPHRGHVVQAAVKDAPRWMVCKFLPHCPDQHLHAVLDRLLSRHMWSDIDVLHSLRIAEENGGAAGSRMRRFPEGGADDWAMACHVVPQCADRQLDTVLTFLMSRGLCQAVGETLQRGVISEARHSQAVIDASKVAVVSCFRRCVLPHCEGDDRLAALSNLVERDLRLVQDIVSGMVTSALKEWVLTGNSKKADIIDSDEAATGNRADTSDSDKAATGNRADTIDSGEAATGNRAETIDCGEAAIGNSKDTKRSSTHTDGNSTATTGNILETTGNNANTTGNSPATPGNIIETTGSSTFTPCNRIYTAGHSGDSNGNSIDNTDTFGNIPDTADNSTNNTATTCKNTPNVGNSAPNAVKNTPNVGNSAPNAVKNTPNVGNSAPNAVKNTPNVGNSAPNFGNSAPNVGIKTDTTSNKTDTTGNNTDTTDNSTDTTYNDTDITRASLWRMIGSCRVDVLHTIRLFSEVKSNSASTITKLAKELDLAENMCEVLHVHVSVAPAVCHAVL